MLIRQAFEPVNSFPNQGDNTPNPWGKQDPNQGGNQSEPGGLFPRTWGMKSPNPWDKDFLKILELPFQQDFQK